MNKIISDCVVKLLPIIDSENEFQWLIPVDKLWLDSSKKFVYEIGGGSILKKLSSFPRLGFGKIYLVNMLEDGKIKTVSIGKELINLIEKNTSLLFDLKSEYHMNVVVEQKVIQAKSFPSFDKSSIIIKSDWIAPVSNINSTEEWTSWIKVNQGNNYLRDIEKNSPFNNREELDSLFDGNFSRIIAENRNKRISKIID